MFISVCMCLTCVCICINCIYVVLSYVGGNKEYIYLAIAHTISLFSNHLMIPFCLVLTFYISHCLIRLCLVSPFYNDIYVN